MNNKYNIVMLLDMGCTMPCILYGPIILMTHDIEWFSNEVVSLAKPLKENRLKNKELTRKRS